MTSTSTKTRAVITAARLAFGVTYLCAVVYGFFWLAGDFWWARGWMYVGLVTLCQSATAVFLWIRDPELIRRRGRVGEGTKAWDRSCHKAFAFSYLGIMVVAALDAGRFGWSSRMPTWLTAVGVGLYLLSVTSITWAMAVNTHFEKTARIQTDRGHKVVDSGPYKIIRHPGYTSTIAGWIIAPPMILGSWWAFMPAGMAAASIVIRTMREDRMLRRELPGYAGYAQRVPYRLIPSVW